jgi:hypothetical protein
MNVVKPEISCVGFYLSRFESRPQLAHSEVMCGKE